MVPRVASVVVAAGLVLLCVLGSATAQIDYTLSAECKADPGSGCCPAFRMVIEMRNSGCKIEDFLTPGQSNSEYAARCESNCGSKLSKLSHMFHSKSGKGCPWVHKALTAFPFVCEVGDAPERCGVWMMSFAGSSLNPPFTLEQSERLCNPCLRKSVDLMSDNEYTLDGTPRPTDKPWEVLPFSTGTYFFCWKMDDRLCTQDYGDLPSLTAAVAAAVADAGTEPSDVDLAALEAATGLCGRPCARGMTVAGFNGQFHDAPVANFDYPHRAGVMLEAGCPNAAAPDGNSCFSTVVGELTAAERQVFFVNLQKCLNLFDESPGTCSQECAGFLTTLKTRLGCCARTPIDFYLADDYLTNALTQGAKSEGLEAQLNTFYKNAMEQCNVGLPTACQSGTKVYTASTHIPALSAVAVSTLPSTTINAMSHGFRVDIASYFGTSFTAITVTGVRAASDYSVIIDWMAQGRTDAETDLFRESYDSLKGMGVPMNNAMKATPTAALMNDNIVNVGTCSADVIDGLHYIPATSKTMTTNCAALQAIRPETDCSQAEYTDSFGNEFW
eukprot:CAMPEP_0197630620 /NCGR_PEP_ID=MMETSP1338-20131121/8042_1 /TAXON_ID=43686 ORGANISM="Pelagodinium beii, Strain RCC1491" /NCGR_SAMPLE_ID=MMETSP1338 /ASSEMBLY_ACC=CAM_ASM_000754 /LENGTH=556 /DNA_ID=CAMNT_0043201877 /DNA_START=141 /DNA_END=1808 /DNA_ORIENTATION=+